MKIVKQHVNVHQVLNTITFPTNKKQRFTYLTIFSNIYALLLFVPYIITWNDLGKFTIRKNIFHKIICACVQCYVWFLPFHGLLSTLSLIYTMNEAPTINHVFQVLENVIVVGFSLSLTYFLWWCRDSLLQLVNSTHRYLIVGNHNLNVVKWQVKDNLIQVFLISRLRIINDFYKNIS